MRTAGERGVSMKKLLCLVLAVAMALPLNSCGLKPRAASPRLYVFAAASMTEAMDEIIDSYKDVAPDVTIIPTYDSSGTLLTQIQEGAECDLFISAAQAQMDKLDEEKALLENTRLELLENKIVLAVPDGNPKGIESFDHLARLLSSGGVMLAMGNSDVPAGQYAQKLFAYYELDEAVMAAAGLLTYASNVKEVTVQVSEGAVDCGIVYATDAASAGLTVVDTATAEMCGQVIYPAAVLGSSRHTGEAEAFLAYLQTDPCAQIFARVGFCPAW